jgi:hypothetical protein
MKGLLRINFKDEQMFETGSGIEHGYGNKRKGKKVLYKTKNIEDNKICQFLLWTRIRDLERVSATLTETIS